MKKARGLKSHATVPLKATGNAGVKGRTAGIKGIRKTGEKRKVGQVRLGC
jgi:hypothetical protein